MKIKREKGFTLIEILLVVVIIGIMLAVIVPRGWRANVDSKYSLVRQGATELASYGIQWAEKGLQAQDAANSTARAVNYYRALAGCGTGSATTNSTWVAYSGSGQNVWSGNTRPILGRATDGSPPNQPTEDVVMDIIPPEKIPTNPFNGVNAFSIGNYPGTAPITGSLACGMAAEAAVGGFYYFGLVFQGTDSTTSTLNTATSFHAGMHDRQVQGLRNGVFLARAR